MADIKFPYEILFRGTDTYEYSGGHIIDAAGGPARGIKANELLPVIAALNAAAVARVDAQAAELVALQAEHEAALKLQADALAVVQAEYDDFKARGTYAAEAARAIIANPSINDAESLVRIDGIAAAMLKDKKERDIEAADKAAADAAAYAAALRAA